MSSKEFFDLVKGIGESRSKQEEDNIVGNEVHYLKEKMATKGVSSKKMKEYLIRMIYVEMLGHDATFGHIHAIKMVSERKLLEKRVGYLAVSLVLHPNHEFMLLLVNSLQIDLRSDNFLEVCMALVVVCKMANQETVPALLPLVAGLLDHKQANVRKKAVMALNRFHQLDPSCVAPLVDKIRRVHCDKDPSVMGATLCLFQSMAMTSAAPFKDLVPSFVSILKQVVEHRLPREYDYHRMPSPWLQLHLLQLLAILGSSDKQASEGMYEVLHEVMKRADIGINVGYAIVFECVKTVTQIYPDPGLIETAALSITRFLTADNHNLKYLGVNALAAIVQINPKYAAEHQLVVIDCLEDPDETLRRKTLDLLYSMTNAGNVVVIVQKLVTYLEATADYFLRADLVNRIFQLSEKFSPTTWWYVETCLHIFELAGTLVKAEVAHNLMRLISEADEMVVDPTGQEVELKLYAIDIFLALLLHKPNLPDILVQVLVWTLGEFGHLSPQANELIPALIQTIGKHSDSAETRCWVLSAITKLSAQLPAAIPTVREVSLKYHDALNVELQQHAHEYLQLSRNPANMKRLFPHDNNDVRIDGELSFLAAFVSHEAKTKPLYDPNRAEGKGDAILLFKKEQPQLKYEYAKPEQPQHHHVAPAAGGYMDPAREQIAAATNVPATLNVSSIKQVWGPTAAAPPVEIAPIPAAASVHGFHDAHVQSAVPIAEPKKFVKKEEPKVMTEKERMAAALFGAANTTVKAKAAIRPASVVTAPTAVHQATAAAAPTTTRPAATGNILDLGLDVAVTTHPATVVPSSSARSVNNELTDLLGEVFGPTPTPAVAAAPQTAYSPQPFGAVGASQIVQQQPIAFQQPIVQQPSFPTLQQSAFHQPTIQQQAFQQPTQPTFQQPQQQPQYQPQPRPTITPHPQPQQQPVARPATSEFELFETPVVSTATKNVDDLLGIGSGAPAAVQQALGVAGMSAGMRGRLASFKQSNEQLLSSNQSFHLSSIKAFLPDRTLAVLCLSNKTTRAFQNVTIQLFQPHPALVLAFDGEPVPQVQGTNVLLQAVPAQSTCVLIVSIQSRDPSWAGSPLNGQVLCSGQPNLHFSQSLDVTDMLRSR